MRGKLEGHLDPITKGEILSETFHADHLGMMEQTTKMYKYGFVVILPNIEKKKEFYI